MCLGKAISKLCASKFAKNLAADERGNLGMAFALLIPVVMFGLGLAIDYSRATKLQDQLQVAADKAALAATTAIGNGSTSQVAMAAAEAQWRANADQIVGAHATPHFAINNTGSSATTSVKFSGSVDATFSQLLGYQTLPVSGGSSTLATVKQIPPVRYSGTGSAWGDPHLVGADGYDAAFACPKPYWYNLLSDGGIQVNVECVHLEGGE